MTPREGTEREDRKGTSFDDLPEDWKCPVCGAGKKIFKPVPRHGMRLK